MTAVLDQPQVIEGELESAEEFEYRAFYPMRALVGALIVWEQWVTAEERDIVVAKVATGFTLKQARDALMARLAAAGFETEVLADEVSEPEPVSHYGMYL